MAGTHSKCSECGSIVPVPPGSSAPEHKDYSTATDPCTGTGQATEKM